MTVREISYSPEVPILCEGGFLVVFVWLFGKVHLYEISSLSGSKESVPSRFKEKGISEVREPF